MEEEDIEMGQGGRWSHRSGVSSMMISSAAYSVMGLLVKILAVKSFPSSQIVAARCGIVALLSGLELRRMKYPLLGSAAARQLVISRAIVGFVALSTYFYSIQVLPLRDATILNFTMPVFTAILATFLLHESWGIYDITGTLFSFLGVLLVIQPQNLVTDACLGVAMAMVGASMGALSYIIIRMVGKHGEPPAVCVFAFAAFSAPMALFAMLFQGWKLPGVIETLELCGVGLSAYAAQIFLTRGLQLEKAAKATSMQYVKVVCSYVLGVVFLGERPSLQGAIGAVLITCSAAFVSGKESTKTHPK
ncbi:solute carrier family 35 member G1 [Selaginella moellendorffii]|nr:solute carrier family 35 member G1 [Selaginella moellendorffii]|eukprot:XP_002973446.2 solute carrier family 35 member G1 [Selaginella moellendorffii]